ncbi:MAG: thiamine phosphate synthase [Pyrinomonadaceae bacterium]|nr:thiamine phosphate synthase [Pyrinomonadaceae bacterium]MBP6211605.1 thiamine phosphate synthase [Pyrinomonadaceae bacterium]
MQPKLPTIYPITDTVLSGISHTEQVRRLTAGGARFIQLREKRLRPSEWLADAIGAVDAVHKAGAAIIINDRVDMAIAIGADGVHLGQDDLPPAEARRLLGAKAIIGYSTHTLEQAAAAALEPVDYIAFGPIFGTTTKADTNPVVGLDLLHAVRQAIGDIPLVAIGGIKRSDLAAVFSAGADSAAMISEVLADADSITANYLELSNLGV